ncbi:mechanosensitive ion channel [Altererythrobacter sp. BO-6]|uniref:mechanosensitive ion channel family protein n=1 Tax=Altererythrobacter sp. BO-6 TaxID=2604537 RepID=UPI0013E0EAF3|nr:mechanosensitive ion channel domain-containing protein [Altererythrobacter sp. BO-6]QIG54914.1 mechanosensitive ion channel [Altererythrobacter sp. BO-6]
MTTTAPPTPAATETPPPPGQAWSVAETAPPEAQDAVVASQGLKEAVASKSETAGSVLESLDSWALTLGDTRISVLDALVVISVIALVIIGAWLLTRISGRIVRRATRLDDTQRLLAQKISTIVIWAAAFFVGIDMLGIDLTALAVFSGAFGLAIGFGLQKTFGNLIAGIILLMDKSIKPGDVIAVADTAGNETFGQIRRIGIRAVSIVTRDQKEYLIPNENLMINQVENWSYSSRNVRVQVPVGVGYACDLDLAEKLMLEAAKQSSRVLKSPAPTAWLRNYGESSVDFIIQIWINDPEEGVGNIRSEVLKNLWRLFKENNVEIPFPQRDINLRNNEQFERLIDALAKREESRSKS